MSEIVKLYITYIEAKREVSRISILDAMKFLLQAWDRVSMETISNVSGVQKFPWNLKQIQKKIIISHSNCSS